MKILDDLIYGRNPVKEALKSGRNLREILISKKSSGVTEILRLAKEKSVIIKFVDPKKFQIFKENTQGVVAYCSAIKFSNFLNVLDSLKKNKEIPFILICDHIQDPHNLGALLRTAYAVGVNCVILPKRRNAPINAVVEKASVGAINFLDICLVTNLVQTIKKLQELGIFIYCADVKGETFYKYNLKGSIALVVGSEGKGASLLVKKSCDALLKIPMKNPIDSLNVSVAGAIIMYEISKQIFFS